MSDLRQAVTDHLAIRQALGFQLRGYDRLLGDLIEDLQRTGAPTLTIELAVAWATKPAGAQPFRWKTRLSVLRGFARYLQTIDPSAQVPPSDLLAYRRARPIPYLNNAAEIDALLAATGTFRPALRAATYGTLLGLLVVTGTRVGEVIALDRDDVDLHERRLAIGGAEHAARQLPLHPSTVETLRALTPQTAAVLRVWQHERAGNADEPLFPTSRGGRLSSDAVTWLLAKHVATAAHACASLDAKTISPHVLRHTAAMRLLHAG